MLSKLFKSHNQNSESLLYKELTGSVYGLDLCGQGYQPQAQARADNITALRS